MRRLWMALLIGVFACGGTGGTAPGGGTAGSGQTSSTTATVVAVGQPMKASDGRTITVLAFKRGFSTGNMFETPKAGHEYVQVTYALANGSSSEWSGPLYEINLIDANGQKYQESFVTTSDNVDSVAAGGHVPSANQVYEVPTGIAIDVAWTPNIFESTVLQTTLK